MEHFLQQKFGKQFAETNITQWRRTVCGDLTSVFKPYNGEKINVPSFPVKADFYASVHKAQFKKDPYGYKPLSGEEISAVNRQLSGATVMPKQEKGIRPSCALPYQLYADGQLDAAKKAFTIRFSAANEVFAEKAAGAPFSVYQRAKVELKIRSYAVAAGDILTDEWPLEAFGGSSYQLQVVGPNGFSRYFTGTAADPRLHITVEYSRLANDSKKLTGNIAIMAENAGSDASYTIEITDNAYKSGHHIILVKAKGTGKEKQTLALDLSKSFGWYDFTIRVSGYPLFEKRYTGHVETGRESFTDPLMGGVVL
jgi:phospholipase C